MNTMAIEIGPSAEPPIQMGGDATPAAESSAFTSPNFGSRMKTQISPTRIGAMIPGANTSALRMRAPRNSLRMRIASRNEMGIRTTTLSTRMIAVFRSDVQNSGSVKRVE